MAELINRRNIQRNEVESINAGPLEARLCDMENRVKDISKRLNNVEEKAYAVDNARLAIVGVCNDGISFTYDIITERVGGAIKVLVNGDQKSKES